MELARPTLILDEQKCRSNISNMKKKADDFGLAFRPHFKTHQSHTVGQWFREAGVASCTVSSVKMAEYFAADGWNDITIAFPLNHHESAAIDKLANKIRLNVCAVAASSLLELAGKLTGKVGVFVEVDTGYHRTGVDPKDENSFNEIFDVIKNSTLLNFKGFLSHAGHSYKSRGVAEVEAVHQNELKIYSDVRIKYGNRFPGLVISIGDTPSMSCSSDFTGIDEIRPGNFVFYDVTQVAIGSCDVTKVSVLMACPVVAVYPEREEVIVHGGAVHFSKDSLIIGDSKVSFGTVVTFHKDKWGLDPIGYAKSISQEHGILSIPRKAISGIKPGDFIGVLPIHSCLTADCMNEYLTTTGEHIAMMR